MTLFLFKFQIMSTAFLGCTLFLSSLYIGFKSSHVSLVQFRCYNYKKCPFFFLGQVLLLDLQLLTVFLGLSLDCYFAQKRRQWLEQLVGGGTHRAQLQCNIGVPHHVMVCTLFIFLNTWMIPTSNIFQQSKDEYNHIQARRSQDAYNRCAPEFKFYSVQFKFV